MSSNPSNSGDQSHYVDSMTLEHRASHDALQWTITTSHPATFRDKSQAAVIDERAKLALRIAPFVSQRWIMTNVFGFSEEEAEKIEYERRSEATELAGVKGTLASLPELPAAVERLAMGVLHAEDDDIAYFQRNMMKALRVPESFMPSEPTGPPVHTIVGPNDYLVIHVPITDIPSNRVEAYLTHVKQACRKTFKDAPFRDRMVFVPHRDVAKWGFSSIRIETQEDKGRQQSQMKAQPPIM